MFIILENHAAHVLGILVTDERHRRNGYIFTQIAVKKFLCFLFPSVPGYLSAELH